jgi:hypothetical protein
MYSNDTVSLYTGILIIFLVVIHVVAGPESMSRIENDSFLH